MTFHPIVERLLELRGISEEDREAFFDPSLKRLTLATNLPGISEAVAIVKPFVDSRRKIVVFGDYDCDGVCACAILVTALRAFGASVEAFIPDRFSEGYGMTNASLERLMREHSDVALIITVDNGISAAREVAQLRERGIAVVVTDHHTPGADIPVADALVNPRVASCPGCENLCGAGVAFFLASALARVLPPAVEKFGMRILVLAGLATVVDIMPVTGQNRILVAQSLAAFARYAPRGLVELRTRAARTAGELRAWDYGFLLGPRVNAAGRIASARLSYDLVMGTDGEVVRELAMKVDNLNAQRKTIESRMAEEAKAGIRPDAAAVVARGENGVWHPGVAGIVAARVMESAGVPVAIAVGDHGSVRAPDGYNVHAALTAASGALTRFGGHAAAGGFSVKEGMFDEFARLFTEACSAQFSENATMIEKSRRLEPDVWVEPSDLTMSLFSQLRQLEPFGEGNEEPVFGLRAVHFRDCRPMGADGRHASFSFVNRDIPRAVWWGHGPDVEVLRMHNLPHDIVFTLVFSDFGGEAHLELRILDVRPASAFSTCRTGRGRGATTGARTT